jgi:hypothetical protein
VEYLFKLDGYKIILMQGYVVTIQVFEQPYLACPHCYALKMWGYGKCPSLVLQVEIKKEI